MISRIRQLQARAFERMLKDSGVEAFNGAQGRILYVLWEHGELTISEIGRLTSLAKTTLTSMLDRMERAELVVRVPDVKNRRQVFVRITDKAKACRAAYDRVSDQMNAHFYAGFSDDEIASLEAMLERLLKNLESAEAPKRQEERPDDGRNEAGYPAADQEQPGCDCRLD